MYAHPNRTDHNYLPGQVWQPKNSGRFGGSYPMKVCLAHSINTAAAYMMKNFGHRSISRFIP